jgi:hypothetical protein
MQEAGTNIAAKIIRLKSRAVLAIKSHDFFLECRILFFDLQNKAHQEK